ncbi:hypothetical protein RQN30_07180 [Arcanobacterium hippocoleae]
MPKNLWLAPWSSGRLVDWLWAGLSERIFSQRMVDVFVACGVAGMEVLPLTIRRKRSADVEGYSLVRFTGSDGKVWYFPPANPYASSIVVTADVKEALVERKLTGFRVIPALQRWKELQDNQ